MVGLGHNPRYPNAPPLPERVLINPVIKSIGDELITGWEGFLSVLALRGEVKRLQHIHLKWQAETAFSIQKSYKISMKESFRMKEIIWMMCFSLIVLPIQ